MRLLEDILDRRLSRDAEKVVKMTAPAFKVFGKEIAESTYDRLLANPEARAIFGEQSLLSKRQKPEVLAEILYPVASNIDAIEKVMPVLDLMARQHVEAGIKPSHFRYLADAMLGAIRDVLGEGASDEVIDGWQEGFWYLSEILIEREAALYREARRDVRFG
jgi:nitric oxide dioxygenase